MDTISTISESQKLKPSDKNFHLIFLKSVLKLKLKFAYISRCGEKATHIHCWWGCRLMQPLWKTLVGKLTQRDGMGREEGRGFRMGNTCIPVADSF